MLVSLIVLFCVWCRISPGHLPTGGGCISLHTGQGSRCGIHKELTFILTHHVCTLDMLLLLYQKLWFPMIVSLGNEDYEYHECVILQRYTQCYTSVILGVILLLLSNLCIASQYVILKRITCVDNRRIHTLYSTVQQCLLHWFTI